MQVRRQKRKRKIGGVIGIVIIILFIVIGILFARNGYQNIGIRQEIDSVQIKYSEKLYYKTVVQNEVERIPNQSLEYVKNELIIDALPDASYEKVENIIEKYNACIVGYIDITNTYQIEIRDVHAYDELLAFKGKLEKDNIVDKVYLNKIYPITNLEGYYPNDSVWKKEWSDTVGGKNWALEFMDVPEAWYYMKYSADHKPQEVNVGVFEVENFDSEHEDLKKNFIEKPLGSAKYEGDREHGTAVSGIIGAGFDNGIGLAGIVPNIKLCGASWNGISDYFGRESNVQASTMVCRVALVYLMSFNHDNSQTSIINVSLSIEMLAFAASRGVTEAIEALDELNKEVGDFLDALLKRGYDFLICKGAGNNNESFGKDKRYYYVRADADDENAVCGYIKASSDEAEKYKKYDDFESRLEYGNVDARFDVFSGIVNPEIKDRIVVVGSIGVTKDNGFYASEYSSSGSRVDILAPGEEIYVLEPDNKYSDKPGWGTSYSAPYVSGIAGLMLSVNPKLSGKELKELLIDSATGEYVGMLNEQAYKYKAVNANAAVRYADVYCHGSYYTWIIEPTIEADNIYYINSNDVWANPINMLSKQMDGMDETYGYAVIKKGNMYGLIDMEGNLLDGMNFQAVSTNTSKYHVTYKEPSYSPIGGELGEEYKEGFDLCEDGLSFGIGYGDITGLEGGIYFWNNGLKQYYLANRISEPNAPIAVCEVSEIFPGTSVEWEGSAKELIEWCQNHQGKYAIYSDGELITGFIYDECGSYSGGLMAVRQGNKWGYINKKGEVVIPIEYDTSWKEYIPLENDETRESKDFCYAASDGYIVLRKENQFELKDIYGKEVIQMGVFEEMRPVYYGKCWVKKNGKWGIIQIKHDMKRNLEVLPKKEGGSG